MKKLVRAQAGVKLKRIKRMVAGQRKQTCYRLTSRRNTSGRVILDENEAHRAFAREVAVYLETRVVNSLMIRARWTPDEKSPRRPRRGQGWVQLDRGRAAPNRAARTAGAVLSERRPTAEVPKSES